MSENDALAGLMFAMIGAGDLRVRAANRSRLDLQQRVASAERRHQHIGDFEFLALGVRGGDHDKSL